MGGGIESRANLTCNGKILAHHEEGVLGTSTASEDVMPDERKRNRNYRWKLEIWENCGDQPALVVIRSDHHPQKSLNGDLQLDDCKWTATHYWMVEPVDERAISPVKLKNKQTGQYLAIDGDNVIHLDPAGSVGLELPFLATQQEHNVPASQGLGSAAKSQLNDARTDIYVDKRLRNLR